MVPLADTQDRNKEGMEKFCCINCFAEQEIKKFIEAKQTIGNCEYCKSESVYVHHVSNVGQFIMEGIERYYEDAANAVGYDSSEGGYLLPTSDIVEILTEEEDIFGEHLDDPNALINDFDIWDGTPYVRKDPYGPPSGDTDEIVYWENFCEVVKSQRRFTAFLDVGKSDHYDLHSDPGKFLFHLAERFMPSLISILPAGSSIYRARIKKTEKEFNHEDLTSPPARLSRNSRMNPAGIPFFYGAMNPETCIHEVRPDLGETVVVGEFELIRNLPILNLSIEIESRRSIFDPEYFFDYEEHFKPFLLHFVTDFARPIRKMDAEIDYVPTQVFTEFIKSLNFKDQWLYLNRNGKVFVIIQN
jgi:hypothetical protein